MRTPGRGRTHRQSAGGREEGALATSSPCDHLPWRAVAVGECVPREAFPFFSRHFNPVLIVWVLDKRPGRGLCPALAEKKVPPSLRGERGRADTLVVERGGRRPPTKKKARQPATQTRAGLGCRRWARGTRPARLLGLSLPHSSALRARHSPTHPHDGQGGAEEPGGDVRGGRRARAARWVGLFLKNAGVPAPSATTRTPSSPLPPLLTTHAQQVQLAAAPQPASTPPPTPPVRWRRRRAVAVLLTVRARRERPKPTCFVVSGR